MAVRIAARWLEPRAVADDVTLLWEPYVGPVMRCNIRHVRGRERDRLHQIIDAYRSSRNGRSKRIISVTQDDPMGRLDDKVAFITGAGAGIGRAAALLFAREGARIAIAELNERGGVETERQIREADGEAFFARTDVTEPESVKSSIGATLERFGKLDVLYNNAGGSTLRDAAVTEAPDDEFWRVIKLDLWGTFLVCKHGIPALISNGGGSVINTSSNLALMGIRGRDCYTAAKGGVASITRSMATEYAEYNIRVNAVAPAATRTERVVKLAAGNQAIENMVQRGQLLGWCEPIHIAYMALYLASDESAVTTGQVIPVDSGATIF